MSEPVETDLIGSTSPRPAPSSSSPLSLAVLTADGVAYLTYWMVIGILLSQAVILALGSQSAPRSAWAAGAVCVIWAAFCLGMGILRDQRSDEIGRPPPIMLPVITAVGCLVSLAVLRSSLGYGSPWTAEVLSAALVVVSVTVWVGARVGGITGLLMIAVAAWGPLSSGDETLTLRTPLDKWVAGVAILGAGFVVALAVRWLARRADQLQAVLDQRDALLVRERSVKVASDLSKELERALHDTALNTLETISAHGEHLDPDLIRARCRADFNSLAAWRSESGLVTLRDLKHRILEHADRLSLEVEVELERLPSVARTQVDAISATVLQAFLGATSEALTNVQKHSGQRAAKVRIQGNSQGIQCTVSDGGGGLAAWDAAGFGVVHSVQERLADVGGLAVIGPGERGAGTVVRLTWSPEVAPQLPDLAEDLLSQVAGIVVVVGVVMAGGASGLAAISWGNYAVPGVAVFAPIVPIMVAAWLLNTRRTDGEIGALHVLCAALTFLGVTIAEIVADPTCGRLLGEASVFDARLPLMLIALLLAPRRIVLIALICTVGLGETLVFISGRLFNFDKCGAQPVSGAAYLIAGLVVTWMFARRIDLTSRQFIASRLEATQAEVRIRSQLSLRREEEIWVSDTLSSAQGLLDAIGGGSVDPAHHATRELCGREAGYLRALLAVGRADESLRRPGRIWLRLLAEAGCSVSVRGSLADVEPPPAVVSSIGRTVSTLVSNGPGSNITLTAWSAPESDTFMLMASGPVLARSATQVAEFFAVLPGLSWHELGDESLAIEWTFPKRHSAG